MGKGEKGQREKEIDTIVWGVKDREGGWHRWMMVLAAKWPARTHSSKGFFCTNWARKPPTNASPDSGSDSEIENQKKK